MRILCFNVPLPNILEVFRRVSENVRLKSLLQTKARLRKNSLTEGSSF